MDLGMYELLLAPSSETSILKTATFTFPHATKLYLSLPLALGGR